MDSFASRPTPERRATRHSLTRLDISPAELFVSQAVGARALAVQGSYDLDVDGAASAGQYGMAYVAARGALRGALFIHRALRGKEVQVPRDLRHMGQTALERMVADADGDETAWLQQAWALETANPITPDEVASFVERVQAFCQSLLSGHDTPTLGTLSSDTEFDHYLKLQEDLSEVFTALGVTGVIMTDTKTRSLRRARIRRGLAGDESDPLEPGAMQNAPGTAVESDASPETSVSMSRDVVQRLERLAMAQLESIGRDIASTEGRDTRQKLIAARRECEQALAHLRSVLS